MKHSQLHITRDLSGESILKDKPGVPSFSFPKKFSPLVRLQQKRERFKGSVWRIMMYEIVNESLGATEQSRCLVTSLNPSALEYEVKSRC